MRAQGIDVGAAGRGLAHARGLFGGHVAGRAHDVAGPRLARIVVETFGQAEIGDLGVERAGGVGLLAFQEHVGWFQVAVDDPLLVGRLHGAGQLFDQLGGDAGRQRSLVDPVRQAAAARRTPARR